MCSYGSLSSILLFHLEQVAACHACQLSFSLVLSMYLCLHLSHQGNQLNDINKNPPCLLRRKEKLLMVIWIVIMSGQYYVVVLPLLVVTFNCSSIENKCELVASRNLVLAARNFAMQDKTCSA